MQEFPALFISHGAPDLVLSKEPARQALVELGKTLPRPKGILILSGHWQESEFTLGEAAHFSTIHDFGGFAEELHELEYPAHGANWLVNLCRSTLEEAGINYASDPDRGLDHGAWIPLMLVWPEADIPVLSLSLKYNASPQENLQLGEALRPLGQSDVLIVASGAITHNLRELLPPGSPPQPWAKEFANWIAEKLDTHQTAELLNYRQLAPDAKRAHPTTEHFEPLLIAYGAGGESPVTRLHQSFCYGNLAMDIYAFGTENLDL